MEFERIKELAAVHGTPTLYLSVGRLKGAYNTLSEAMPGVALYYAVKSNASPEIISILKGEGSYFDVCTNGEIDIVSQCGVAPIRCIHTHPIKRDGDIRYALDFGMRIFVVDNEDELVKFLPYKDKAELLIRMSIQNPGCLVNLSHKFGVAPERTFSLLQKAHDMGLKVKGLSFHAGSQNENPYKYIEALEYCRDICRKAALRGINIEVIDIGGGFPIEYLTPVPAMAQFCHPVNEYLERYFKKYKSSQSRRVLSGPSMTLATKVMGRALRNGVWWYYLMRGFTVRFPEKSTITRITRCFLKRTVNALHRYSRVRPAIPLMCSTRISVCRCWK